MSLCADQCSLSSWPYPPKRPLIPARRSVSQIIAWFEQMTGNGKLKDELLNGEIFYSLKEAQIIIEQWRIHYNTKRPHSSLGYRPPAPATRAIKPTPINQMTIMQ